MPRAPDIPGLTSALELGRLVFLRRPVGKDKAEYVKLREASEVHLLRWEPLAPDGRVMPHDEAFDRFLTSSDTDISQRLLICRASDGVLVGQVSLNQIFRGPFLSCMAGYWIGLPHVRRGYMLEGLRLACRFAFGPLKLHRVEANIIPRNTASKAVVKKLGFRFEGLALRYLQIAGVWEDHEHWTMLADEFEVKPAFRPTRRAKAAVRAKRRPQGPS